MRVLLINPPYSAAERYGKDLGKFGPLNEPLGLAYLGAHLEHAGHEVSILDAPAMGLSGGEICGHMGKGDYHVAGITMLTPMYSRTVEVVQAIRRTFPSVKTVVGGPHPTVLPGETLAEIKEIDFAVIGEGECILSELVTSLEKDLRVDHIQGLAYRVHGEVLINPPPKPIDDLDVLPMPARHLLPMHAYRMTRSRTRRGHAFTVSVARGCPFRCAFCCRIFGRKVRHHSVDRILNEIRILVTQYGAKEINLEADTLTFNRHFIMSLCEGLIASGLSRKIIWTCESRVDSVSEEILRRMKEAGCWQISYGVETGSQRLLDLIQKDITLGKIEKTFQVTKRTGISIRAFFMLGLPTETREESLKTISFAKRLDARWSQFTLCTPFPGTELYDLAVREGTLKFKNWSDFKTHGGWTEGHLPYVPRGRSLEEMKKLQKTAYRAVYLRPRVFFRFLADIRSLANLNSYALGFWVLLKTLFHRSERTLRVCRIKRDDLRRFSEGVYVDSPVYFSQNPLVKGIQWSKLDFALSHLSVENHERILDYGCGNGVMLPTLAGRFKMTVGIDLHTTAAWRLARAYHLKGVHLVTTDGTLLPFKQASFCAVLALSSLEHFLDLERAIAEIERVLMPGGFLLFLSPSENRFYQLGRKLLGLKKPRDHYHGARKIEQALKHFLTQEMGRSYPMDSLRFLSMYRLVRLRKVKFSGVSKRSSP